MSLSEREIETKYSVHGLFTMPDLIDPDAGIADVERRPALNLRATYVDTPSLRLARAGVTMRHRTGDGAARWTLKLPTGTGSSEAGLSRDEISVVDAALEVPTELALLLTGLLRGDEVGPVAILATHRETTVLLDSEGTVLGEVVDDTVSLLDGRRVVTRFREIEIERSPAEDALGACQSAGRRLLAAGAVEGEQLPKLVRALGPQAQKPNELPPPPEVSRQSPAGDLVLHSLRSGLARLVAADLAVRRGEDDAIHQMRVTCRRLRSDLRTFAVLLDDPREEELRQGLGWLGRSFGDARDLEVLRARITRTALRDRLFPLDQGGYTEIRRLLREQEELAVEAAVAALATPRYIVLLQLLVAVATEPGLSDQASRACGDVLPEIVGPAWSKLARRANALRQNGPDHDWHRARILAKRARYAADVAAVALGKDARATAAAATRVQELLGEHQDAAMAADRMVSLGLSPTSDARTAVTCGRLAERERAGLTAVRSAFPAVWRDTKGGRATRWLGA